MNVHFLGTGTSHGVPSIDCEITDYKYCRFGVCSGAKEDPKLRRTRASIMIESNGKNILIDVSADFRYQMLRDKVRSIDAVLITHIHMDHIAGMPDIRSYTWQNEEPLGVYGSEETTKGIAGMYTYMFKTPFYIGKSIPSIELKTIEPTSFELFGTTITPIHLDHGGLKGCFGYRVGNIAYMPDLKKIRDDQWDKLKGLDCLILDCLRDEPLHPTHLILEESLEIARKIKPKKCYFTHLAHDIHYKHHKQYLDEWMDFSYDGLKISV